MKLILILLFMIHMSCSENIKDPGYPYVAEVLNMFPDSTIDHGTPKFQVSPQKFKYLKNIKELDGDFLRILFGVKIKIKSLDGSLVQLTKQSKSETPSLRYKIENGVIIPRDYNTLMTLSAYYQFEKIYDELENFTGISQNDFTKWSGKIDVLYEPTTEFEINSTKVSSVSKFNAAYDPENKSFLIFQRSQIEQVPLSNLQVLAHEFGHAIFDYIFFKPSPNNNEFFQNSYTFHGINEGFADFMSFVLTSSTDVLRASMSFDTIANQRHFSQAPFIYDNINQSCSLGFYCVGTVFAKSMFNAMLSSNMDTNLKLDRYNFSKKIISTLGKSLNYMKSEYSNFQLKTINSPSQLNSFNEDDWLGLFLRSIINGMESDADKKLFCTEFYKHFTEKGFATTFKEGVCPR